MCLEIKGRHLFHLLQRAIHTPNCTAHPPLIALPILTRSLLKERNSAVLGAFDLARKLPELFEDLTTTNDLIVLLLLMLLDGRFSIGWDTAFLATVILRQISQNYSTSIT